MQQATIYEWYEVIGHAYIVYYKEVKKKKKNECFFGMTYLCLAVSTQKMKSYHLHIMLIRVGHLGILPSL